MRVRVKDNFSGFFFFLFLLLSRTGYGQEFAPGQLLVRFQPQTSPLIINSINSQIGATILETFPLDPDLFLVRLPSGQNLEGAIEFYERQLLVIHARKNHIIKLAATPNDLRNQQWNMHNTGQTGGTVDRDIDGPEAWDNQTGTASVTIAVIDTGIDFDHQDLAANIWTNTAEAIGDANGDGCPGLCGVDDDGDLLIDEGNPSDDDENGYVDDLRGWNFITETNNVDDDSGHSHGTNVAGIIAAVGNNGIGVTGVMWTARLMALKAFDAAGNAFESDIIQALDYATAKGVPISNNSWETPVNSPDIRTAIQRAFTKNQLVIVAAGNGGADAVGDDNDVTPTYPCAWPNLNIVCVAAVDHNGLRAPFSNFGTTSLNFHVTCST